MEPQDNVVDENKEGISNQEIQPEDELYEAYHKVFNNRINDILTKNASKENTSIPKIRETRIDLRITGDSVDVGAFLPPVPLKDILVLRRPVKQNTQFKFVVVPSSN